MILIPAAGDGTRFAEAGFSGPKHLLPLGGVPMIERVLQNVAPLDHSRKYVVVTQDMVGKTRGAVETLLKAKHWVDLDDELVVANCDQLINLQDDFSAPPGADGVVFTFPSANRAHSYVITEAPSMSANATDGTWITGIVEKPDVPPSLDAVSGVYWFKRARDLFDALDTVLNSHENTGGELYLSTALALMLSQRKYLCARRVPTAILGTPEDFQRFEVALQCAS